MVADGILIESVGGFDGFGRFDRCSFEGSTIRTLASLRGFG
jgi:hypothetical protein